ncbi:hypothetical protein TorRG33x02_197470 [Trema orientale]|uniref:Uncharacterized protein n=1 Tax=Trema orientale TaxID=63057 RepID=A0A2P5EFY2_TREOI|nr:hypothetical protein TorRG33x02_197470 [Trema orientale]
MQVFDRDTALAILKVKPLPDPCEDMLIWKGSCSGEFSVKGAHWLDQQTRFNRKEEIWKILWKVMIYERHKILL